jgi:hypothetical protein
LCLNKFVRSLVRSPNPPAWWQTGNKKGPEGPLFLAMFSV